MQFENLPEVHTTRNAKRGENDVNRIAVFIVRHVSHWQYATNHTLVTVTPGQLVTDAHISYLRDGNNNLLDNAALELIAFLARENTHADNATALTSLHAKTGVLHILCLITEDTAEKSFLWRKLGLALRGNLADEDVA